MMVVAAVLSRDRVGLREKDLVRVQRDELEIRPLPIIAMMVRGRAIESRPWKFQRTKVVTCVQSESSPGFNPNRGVASPGFRPNHRLVSVRTMGLLRCFFSRFVASLLGSRNLNGRCFY